MFDFDHRSSKLILDPSTGEPLGQGRY
jgi:hypothetical protein